MKWRLREGQGEALYEIGVEDNGVLTGLSESDMNDSLSTLQRMANVLGAATTILRERTLENGRMVTEVLVRKVSQKYISKQSNDIVFLAKNNIGID